MSSSGVQVEDRQSFLSRLCIASADFVEHELRYAKFKLVSSRSPPFFGQLLVASNNEIPTRPSRQITWYRRFEVNTLRHDAFLSQIANRPNPSCPSEARDSRWPSTRPRLSTGSTWTWLSSAPVISIARPTRSAVVTRQPWCRSLGQLGPRA